MELLSEKFLSTIRPWWKFTSRAPAKPLEFVATVEKLQWCRYCQMDVSTQIEQAMNRGLYVYRKNCLRCGGVMAYGMAKSDINKPGLPDPRVWEFFQEFTRDRR